MFKSYQLTNYKKIQKLNTFWGFLSIVRFTDNCRGSRVSKSSYDLNHHSVIINHSKANNNSARTRHDSTKHAISPFLFRYKSR